jgi:hypothetical protein
MTIAEINAAMRAVHEPYRSVTKAQMEDRVLASALNVEERVSAEWDAIVDHKLIEWGNDQSAFQDEGLIGPTNQAIQKAHALVSFMRSNDWPLPTGVVPDGEGGIVFENRHEPTYQRIEIEPTGKMCLVTFRNCHLVSRDPVDVI